MRRVTEASPAGGAPSGKGRLVRRASGAASVVTIWVAVGAAPPSFHLAEPAPFHAATPPAGATGGFGEPSCAFCHIGSDVNAFGGSVRVEGLPAAYELGREYILTVDLRADETVMAGFQLAARFQEGVTRGRSAGHLEPVDGRTAVVDSLGVGYIAQTNDGSSAHAPSGARWPFAWQAPADGGPVVF